MTESAVLRHHTIYCRGCQRAWVQTERIGMMDVPPAPIDDCECMCTDDTDPNYEAWVVDPPAEDIPEGAWER